MKSAWSDAEAGELIEHYAALGIGEDLSLRVYTSRLLGREPNLVLHGGGNTSVKTRLKDLSGEMADVLCVKGSGWDLATIEPEGLPAVRLAPLRRARSWDGLSDEDMVALQRSNLLNPASPNPSVETLLHAYLPQKFIDHAHATAILAVSDQADGEERCREIFGGRMAIVPYVMPGFALAKATADAFEAQPGVEGVILHKHGIFTFGESAKDSYERMIRAVSKAEDYIAKQRKRSLTPALLPARAPSIAELAPIIRGTCAEVTAKGDRRGFLMTYRSSEAILRYVNGADVADYGTRGVITPDHNIRIKNKPLVLPAPDGNALDRFKADAKTAVADYIKDYEEYFATHNAQKANPRTQLDPMPRVVLVPGIGLFGLGKSRSAADVAADLSEVMVTTITDAEAIGAFDALPETDLFDMEYWSLEQAKLGKNKELPLGRRVAVITGAAGTIGGATAELFAANGACVALLDRDLDGARAIAERIGSQAIALQCDVTQQDQVRHCFDVVCETFGGADILVSNAGAPWQGEIATLSDKELRASFDLNFFAHQTLAKQSVRIMKAQDTGGVLLFNTSKQAINPGKNFGAYGAAKAAALFLSRQYALEYGSIGIRSNAVNADRIKGGLLTDDLVKERSGQRGVTPEEYLAGNLLGKEVEAVDVAEAFLHLAVAQKTTAHVITVDGGNIPAALR